MSIPLRYFTPREAEKLLPLLEERMGAVRVLKRQVDAKVADWKRRTSSGTAPSAAEQALAVSQADFLVSQINERLEEIQKLGCLPKDLDQGLVDFPARVNGGECFLCWKLGETRVGYWHSITGGYGSRKPLPAAMPA
jgi:hypothetical protein